MAVIRASIAEEELHAAAEVEGDALVVELVGAGLEADAFSTGGAQATAVAGMEEEADGNTRAGADGLSAELLARLATLEASALAQRSGLVEWTPGVEQPLPSRSEAVKKPSSVRTRRSLLSLTRLWWLWVDKADIEVQDGRPSWEQAEAFLACMANSRRQRSLMMEERRGLGANEVELFTVLLHRSSLESRTGSRMPSPESI